MDNTREKLIEAIKSIPRWFGTEGAVESFADSLLEVDVVRVVRCKDCIYAKNNYLVHGLCLCEKVIHNAAHGDRPRNTLMCEDDFCSYGERKDNG